MSESDVIAQLQSENEQLRRKLAYLFMRQESLWEHIKCELHVRYRAWRAAHSEEEFQLALMVVVMTISLLVEIIRKRLR